MLNVTKGLNRRSFLKGASLLAIAATLGTVGLWGCTQRGSLAGPTPNQPSDVPWKTTIVGANEAGEPLIVSGTVYAPDGRTPLEGINLFVYQTDATGRYSTTGGNNRNTRIHGLMRTISEGSYEFRTIYPAPYPAARNPAQIYAFVSGPNYPEYWIDEYLFADDPFITDEARRKFGGKGSFSSLMTVQRGADGVLRAVRDIKVERCTNNCTGS
jgi:protocatechuate 3,4-dioxygenase beta subunit